MIGGYLINIVCFVLSLSVVNGDDIHRQSIVFYEETPDVYYCPQEKPVSLEGKLITNIDNNIVDLYAL